MKSTPLFREVLRCPEYKQYRKQQKREVLFYSLITTLICIVGFCSKNGDFVVFSEFLLTGFIVSLILLIAYAAKRPTIHKGLVTKKEKSGQVYVHTVNDESEEYLCTYRTLGDSDFKENDSVYVLNKSHLIKIKNTQQGENAYEDTN